MKIIFFISFVMLLACNKQEVKPEQAPHADTCYIRSLQEMEKIKDRGCTIIYLTEDPLPTKI